MIKWVWALLLTLWFPMASPVQAGLNEGDKVPSFTLKDKDDQDFRFPEDARGKVVLVNFWASWCPECKVELPELIALKEAYGRKPFLLLCVNMDRKRKTADKFLRKLDKPVPVLYDNDQKLVSLFQPVGVPASFLIGSGGRIRKVYIGFEKGTMELYKRDITQLLETAERSSKPAQKEPAVANPAVAPEQAVHGREE